MPIRLSWLMLLSFNYILTETVPVWSAKYRYRCVEVSSCHSGFAYFSLQFYQCLCNIFWSPVDILVRCWEGKHSIILLLTLLFFLTGPESLNCDFQQSFLAFCFLFPSPVGGRRFFSYLYSENLLGFLKVTPTGSFYLWT